MIHTRFAALAAVILLASAATAAPPDPLAKELDAKAPKLLELLKKKGYSNVGVIKFLVRYGEGSPQDNTDLNLSLANKVEVALILANPDEKFGIISQACETIVKEKMTSANHLDADGRKAFFTRKFPLAWSGDKVEPAAFLTGLATLSTSNDNKTLTVKFQCFDKTGAIEDLPVELTVPADPKTVAEAGQSFALSRQRQKALVTGGPAPQREELAKEALQQIPEPVKPAKKEEPLPPFAPYTQSPVKWTILYNDKVMPVSGDAVPTPKKGDKVHFLLENPGPGTYAVVLMVNGESTLYREKSSIEVCRKWVLEPGTSVEVRGFQTNADKTDPFEVLPPEQADEEAVNYGHNAGTFRLVVLHGTLSDQPILHEEPNPQDATAMAIARTRGAARPEGVKSGSLLSLQADLRGRYRSGDGARGLIVSSKKSETFETKQVHFVASTDVPVADVSLRYFKPGK